MSEKGSVFHGGAVFAGGMASAWAVPLAPPSAADPSSLGMRRVSDSSVRPMEVPQRRMHVHDDRRLRCHDLLPVAMCCRCGFRWNRGRCFHRIVITWNHADGGTLSVTVRKRRNQRQSRTARRRGWRWRRHGAEQTEPSDHGRRRLVRSGPGRHGICAQGGDSGHETGRRDQ